MSKQSISKKLDWNSFQSKLRGCGYSNTDLSSLYSLYKSNQISDKVLEIEDPRRFAVEKCDLLDSYLKVSPTKTQADPPATKNSNMLNLPDEILFKTTDSMSIKDITALCKSNPKLNLQLCDNDKFWIRRLEKDFEIKTFTPEQIYKKHYKPENMYILMTDYMASILIGVYKTKEKALKRAKYFLLKQIEEGDTYEDLDEFIKDYENDNELTEALGRPMKTKKKISMMYLLLNIQTRTIHYYKNACILT